MQYLPVCLNLRSARVLLVGGGQVALRKARLLCSAGASICVVAPDVDPELRSLLREGQHDIVLAPYDASHLANMQIVVAATNDPVVNESIYQEARAANTPVNVVDQPELCTFIFPAIVDRDPLIIAISSSGQSPVLARILRRRLETLIAPAYGQLARFAGRLREAVQAKIGTERERRLFWEDVLESDIAQQVLAGQEERAEALLLEKLEKPEVQSGQVALIGAGPGDPELLTLKALRVLQQADVVLYDRLVSDAIVNLARRDARKIYVGKRRSDHAVPQPDINQLLLELAQGGERVVRLKGGDPFIFGRGGEEIELLTEHQIAFEVIPGITAANGASCYAGIPLTHRDYAQSVRFVAGYLKGDSIDHDWSQFQSTTETLVFYMGLVGLEQICSGLMAHGRDPQTPIALIERGTAPEQRVLVGSLADMPERVRREKPAAPTLIIVGDVVRLHDALTWFRGRGGIKPD